MVNLLGYAASCAVLATFLMQTMVSLRLVAILSNVLFAAFGYAQHIYPVLFLHAVLLPINLWRLMDIQRTPRTRHAYSEIVDELERLPDQVLADFGMTRQEIREFARSGGGDGKRDAHSLHHARLKPSKP